MRYFLIFTFRRGKFLLDEKDKSDQYEIYIGDVYRLTIDNLSVKNMKRDQVERGLCVLATDASSLEDQDGHLLKKLF